jgi:hypothetical protein
VRESTRGKHAEAQNSQGTAEEGRRGARLAEAAVQGKRERDPQHQDYEIQAVLHRARHSEVGKPRDWPLGAGRLRPDENSYYYEDEDKEKAADNSSQAAPP